MTLTKSKPNDISRPDGNTLYLYLDETSNTLKLIDIYGNVAPLSDYIAGGGGSIENAGTGAEVYKVGTTNPSVLRTIKQGTRVTINQNANDIEINADLQTLENLGIGAQVYKAGTNNPSYFRSLRQGSNILISESADEITFDVPVITGTPLYYGSFYSTQLQTTVGSEQKIMTFNNTVAAATSGVSIVSGSEITVANAGIYNVAFSAQIKKTSGGGATQIYIWLKKNGVNVPDSNTSLTLANNGDLLWRLGIFY